MGLAFGGAGNFALVDGFRPVGYDPLDRWPGGGHGFCYPGGHPGYGIGAQPVPPHSGNSYIHGVWCFDHSMAIGCNHDPRSYWDERVYSMVGRIKSIMGQIINQTDVTDSFLFIVLMSCLFWIFSVNAGYVLTRYANAWRIILPAGLTVMVIHYYHNCPVVNLRQCVNIDVRNGSIPYCCYIYCSPYCWWRVFIIFGRHAAGVNGIRLFIPMSALI